MISVFTPTNDSQWLPELYTSLMNQTDPDWEWIIAYNNGAKQLVFEDKRVRSFEIEFAPAWVGPTKAFACKRAQGDILLELDHDDLLAPTAVERVKAAFTDPDVGFVYSNTVHTMIDWTPTKRFDERFGWKYRKVMWDGHELDEHISFPPRPDSVSRIWFAPNHLRAFRRSVYEAVGGYNKDMRILDDLDLMCRMYLATTFKHINEPLYLYRVHGKNAWLRYNAEIQKNVYRIYDDYIEKLAIRWADLEGLMKLDLGAAIKPRAGFMTVDLHSADMLIDLNEKWPLDDSSVGVIRAADVFEHLRDPLHTMKEVYRVLAPGGMLMTSIPSTDGRGAFQDPTHVSFWNENSFKYYTTPMAQYIGTPVRFQVTRLYTTEKNKDQVCWVIAHLISLKGGYRPPGLVEV